MISAGLTRSSYASLQPLLKPSALRAELARRRLLDFAQFTLASYRAGRVHALLASELEAVERGDVLRLMVFMPPRTGKTELLIRFVAWTLGRHPDWPLLYTSYGADLAWEKSGEARAVVEGEEFGEVFGARRSAMTQAVEIDPASRAVQRWKIKQRRGGVVAQGVGGPITGKGGRVIIIDDPVKNREEAESPTMREKAWGWYTSTLRTRLEPGGAIVLVMTRWHMDDLAGRLLSLAEQDHQADQWRVVKLPAIALPGDAMGRAPGEALDPARFDEAALATTKASIGSRDWSALYQQEPLPAEGGMFKLPWFTIVDAAPRQGRRVRYWDKAATAGGGDYSAGVLMVRSEGLYYVEDVVRGQWSAGERNRVMLQTAQMDRERYGGEVVTWVEQEGGSGGKESAEATIQLLAGYSVAVEHPTGSKEVRAMPYAAQAEAGNVRLVKGLWNRAYLEELGTFPLGAHDDQVDASSGAFNKLATGGWLMY